MIKQIGAKKIDAVLERNLKAYGMSSIKQFLPSKSYRSPMAFPKSPEKKALLPPMSSKPQLPIPSQDPPVSKFYLPEAEEGFLLMGDVITLIATESQDVKNLSGVISGDGIAHNFLDCISTDNFVNTDKVQFRLCLFRIEPVGQYGYSKILKTYSKVTGNDAEKLEKLREIEKEEQRDNEDEAELSYGKIIKFGERVQLRHIHSNSYVTTSRDVSKERGCLQVILDPFGNEGSWLEIKSCSLIRHDGESIRYSDQFLLTITLDGSKYFLHMGLPKSWKDEVDLELNASSNFTHWQGRKFISHSEIKANPTFVATGDSFRIVFKQSEGYLSVSPRNLDEILPSDLEIDATIRSKSKDKKESACKVYVEKDLTCLSVWELVRENPFIGGLAEKESMYRIKHVATGLFLCVKKTGEPYLTYERDSDFSLFRIIQEKSENVFHTFDTLIKIESPRLRQVLAAGAADTIESMFFSNQDAAFLPVFSTYNRKQNTKTTFALVDEAEDRTIYVYQMSSLLPKLIDFYKYFRGWATLKRGNTTTQSFEIAKSTEPELESKINFLLKILYKIKKRVLVEGPMLKERQDILRHTGFLEFLVKFVVLLDKKLELPSKFPIDGLPKHMRKSKLKMILHGPKHLSADFFQFPAAIGVKHFQKLAVDVYETIYLSIKDNLPSCVALQKHQEFFSSQLVSYKDQVGILLKEVYKLSSGTFARSNPSLFALWIDQIKPISEKDANYDEQLVTFKILASLCTNQDKAIPMNQNILANNFFSSERDYLVLKLFFGENQPFIGLMPDKSMSFTDFLLNNPELSGLALDENKNVLLIYLTSLTNHRPAVNYVSSILNFFINIAMDQNEEVAKKLITKIGLNFNHVFAATANVRIHCKIRKVYLKLLWILYFDKDTQVILNEKQQRCFLWDPVRSSVIDESTLIKAKTNIFEKLENKPIPLARVIEWINEIWVSEDFPFGEFPKETLADKVRFIIELIKFSKDLINLGYVSYGFIENISKQLLSLIQTKSKIQSNAWTNKFKPKLENLRNESLQIELISTIIEFFQIKHFAKINTEVNNNLLHYSGLEIKHQISQKKPVKSKIKKRRDKLEIIENTHEKNLNSREDENYLNEENKQEGSLDTVLLNLLFNHTDKGLKTKIIELLLSNFNLNKDILKAFNDIVLLPPGDYRETYLNLKKMITDSDNIIKKIKYIDPNILVNGITQDNPEISTLKKTLTSTLRAIKSTISKKINIKQLEPLQTICKNLNLHCIILKLFTDDWDWLSKTGSKIKIAENTMELYRFSIKTLINFCFKNTQNQILLYSYTRLIESFKGNHICTKELLAEVLKSHRSSSSSIEIIERIFQSMGQRQSPLERPQDLSVIKSLIYDENLKFCYANQTTVVKSLLGTKNLHAVFTCDTTWDLSKFSSKSIKFFSTMLDILSWCSIFNDYATHQARRMIPYTIIIKEMNNTSMLLIKKSYLHFLFYVFFMQYENVERELPENILEDIMMNIIVPDISKYKKYIEHLITISMKEMYDPIPLKKDSELSSELKKPENFEVKKKKKSKLESLTREQAEALEYWKYINSHKPDTPRISTGILCVVKDITQEFKLSEKYSVKIAAALYKIKCELQSLTDELFAKMNLCEDLDFHYIVSEVCTTMLEIPFFVPETEMQDNNNIEEQTYGTFLELLQRFVEDSHLVFEEFVEKYLDSDENFISRYDFFKIVKAKWKLQITAKDIECLCLHLTVPNSFDVDLMKIRNDLKQKLIGKSYIVRKERVPVIPPKIYTFKEEAEKFKKFLQVVEINYDESHDDIELMVSKVRTELIGPALKNDDTSVLLTFIQNLSLAFQKPEHKIYLINILKNLLKQIIEDSSHEHDSEERSKNVSSLQNLYATGNVIEICFNEFTKNSPFENTLGAVGLLCQLVSENNTFSKKKVLDYLKTVSFSVFSYIKSLLREVQDILTSSISRLPANRKRTLSKNISEVHGNKKYEKSVRLCQQILFFLQLCCDNCFLPFQDFLQVQNPQNLISNVDLVTEISQFLIRLEGVIDLKEPNVAKSLASDITIQCIKTLTDCCQGPCQSNQILLGQSRKLYGFMNWIFTNENPDFSQDTLWLEIYTECVNFLNALIEANTNLKVAKSFIREIDLEIMSHHAVLIWKQIVEGRENVIYQENKGRSLGIGFLEINGKHLEDFEKKVVETGFDIYILLLNLQYMHPIECNLKLGDLFQSLEEGVKSESLRPGFFELLISKCKKKFKHPIHDSSNLNDAKARDFYYTNIGSVEINNREVLSKIFFRIPNMCRYMTKKSQSELITKVNRSSHQEKIEDFCNKSKVYEVEMIHQQQIARYPFLDSFISNWRFYGKVSYVTVVCINVILLSTVSHVDGSTGDWEFSSSINNNALLTFVAVIQIILASLVYVCYLIEYYPVIKFRSSLKDKGSQTFKYHYPEFNRMKGTELMKEVLLRTETKTKAEVSNVLASLEMIFLDFECVYNLIYLIISILCWKFTLLYSVLLLDLIKRNPDLKNILRSITLNSKQLLITAFLGLIFLYIFSIVGFLNYASFYTNDFTQANHVLYCDSLVNCLIATTITGIREGGGIGDALVQPTIDQSSYWGLMFFNLLYFAIVTNILLNIIFGIIIDTFGELRDKNQAETKDIKENCFICGNQNFLFEVKRISWGYHINIEHNPRAYLAFLIYIRHKPVDECTGAEKYVKEKLEKNETSFFPLTALSLNDEDEDMVEELDEVQHKVKKILLITREILEEKNGKGDIMRKTI